MPWNYRPLKYCRWWEGNEAGIVMVLTCLLFGFAIAVVGAAAQQPLVCSSLDSLQPDLVPRVVKLQAVMELVGHPVWVVETYRSPERQAELYEQGRTQPGPVVTWVKEGSAHQEGRAVDLAFRGRHPWGEEHPWEFLGRAGQLLGLEWGGPRDRGHFER